MKSIVVTHNRNYLICKHLIMSCNTDVHENEESGSHLVDPIEKLIEQVKDVYLFRDHYFENHSINDAKLKNDDVEDHLRSALGHFDILKESACKRNRAMFYHLKGRALNVTPNFSKDAEDLLSKAVKLDPKLVDAWNELGECYWKKDDLNEAQNCFVGALSQKRNKVSLRNLSMLLRQQPTKSSEERVKNIEQGLDYAKEAVQMDTNDGKSWMVLGNAYLSSFFTISQNPKILKQAMSAYLQAEKHIAARDTPELHYNKAVAFRYEEDYCLALDSLARAQALDPTWDVPTQKEKELIKYLKNVQELTRQKGKLKSKKLQQLLQSLDPKQLGPYCGGGYKPPKGETVKLELIPLNSLHPGVNVEKVVLGKVVCSVHCEETVPFTFCLIDKEETCVAVTVYNLAQGKGVIIGDSVAIPEPFFSEVNVKSKDKEVKFKAIRVVSPLVMVVNGKKVSRDLQAGTQMSSFKKL